MHHSFGTFPLEPDFSPASLLTPRRGQSLAEAARVADMLRSVMDRLHLAFEHARKAPDLLRDARADASWLHPTYDELVAPTRGDRKLRLAHCERDDRTGTVALAMVDELRKGKVREHDYFHAGFAAVRGEDGGLQVLPRVYRLVCRNGAVVLSHHAEDVLAEHGDVREAVRACLAPHAFGKRLDRLRRATAVRLNDPLAALLQLDLPVPAHEVLASREDDDPTAYGLVNALTARARREPSLPRRLEIERKAEDLLQHALLLKPQPAREREAWLSV